MIQTAAEGSNPSKRLPSLITPIQISTMPRPKSTRPVKKGCTRVHRTPRLPAVINAALEGRGNEESASSARIAAARIPIMGPTTTLPMLNSFRIMAMIPMNKVEPRLGTYSRATIATDSPIAVKTAPLNGTLRAFRTDPRLISTIPHRAPKTARVTNCLVVNLLIA
jgi:hypothetical protein